MARRERVALTQQSGLLACGNRIGDPAHTECGPFPAPEASSPYQPEQDKTEEDVIRQCQGKQTLASRLNERDAKAHLTTTTPSDSIMLRYVAIAMVYAQGCSMILLHLQPHTLNHKTDK